MLRFGCTDGPQQHADPISQQPTGNLCVESLLPHLTLKDTS